MSGFGYVSAQTVEEAVAILAGHPEGRLVAGGQTLLLQANRDRIAGSLLVDLRKIPSLRGIDRDPDGAVRIGAMTTIADIASSELVRKALPSLAEAADLVGDAQVRNRATLGGSLAITDPEADLPALMLALNASIDLTGPRARRKVPADIFFGGSVRTASSRDELISSVVIPALPGHSGTAYLKFKHPARLYAVCGIAALVTLENGRVAEARLAVTGSTDCPCRLTDAEQAIGGKLASEAPPLASSAVPSQKIGFRGDFFASAEYRRHLTQVLTVRALKQAIARAT